MSNVLTLPLRISSRYLLTFKILASAGVALLTAGAIWLLLNSPSLLTIITSLIGWGVFIATLVLALVRFKRYRNVIWNGDHLLVKDEVDIMVPLNEIREVELKALNGVHAVHLLEEHPYLGESFFFLGSLNYFFRHRKVDFVIQELNERIAETKREAI